MEIAVEDAKEEVLPFLEGLHRSVGRAGAEPVSVVRALASSLLHTTLGRFPHRKRMIENRIHGFLPGMAWAEYPKGKRGGLLDRVEENAAIIILYNGGMGLQEILQTLKRSFWKDESETDDPVLLDRLETRIRDLRNRCGESIAIARSARRVRDIAPRASSPQLVDLDEQHPLRGGVAH